MKTTLDLDDAILAQAKRRSAALGTTLKAFVEDALRARLVRAPAGKKPFRYEMKVVHGTRPPAIDVSDRRALHDFLDETE